MEGGSMSTDNRVVEKAFEDYMGWRAGILKVLTSDKGWEVKLPWEELPGGLQEPCVGVNFGRGSILSKEWLSLEAARSDAWLARLSKFYTAALEESKKKLLLNTINELPKLHDMVTKNETATENKIIHDSGENTATSTRSKRRVLEVQGEPTSTRSKISVLEVQGEPSKHRPSPSMRGKETFEQAKDEEDGNDCGCCGGSEKSCIYWIACDTCGKWFHCKCVEITLAEAKSKPSYKCQSCTSRLCGICGEFYRPRAVDKMLQL